MENKLKKRFYLMAAVAILTFIVASELLADWEHFKDGLFS